jgi:WD40 repeat protein
VDANRVDQATRCSTCIGHDRKVYKVALDPTGRRLAVACDDGKTYLYDTTSGKLLGEPLKHEGPVLEVGFSPDGRRLVTGSRNESNLDRTGHPGAHFANFDFGRGEARVYDVESGRMLTGPIPLGRDVTLARFSP